MFRANNIFLHAIGCIVHITVLRSLAEKIKAEKIKAEKIKAAKITAEKIKAETSGFGQSKSVRLNKVPLYIPSRLRKGRHGAA